MGKDFFQMASFALGNGEANNQLANKQINIWKRSKLTRTVIGNSEFNRRCIFS